MFKKSFLIILLISLYPVAACENQKYSKKEHGEYAYQFHLNDGKNIFVCNNKVVFIIDHIAPLTYSFEDFSDKFFVDKKNGKKTIEFREEETGRKIHIQKDSFKQDVLVLAYCCNIISCSRR